MKQLKTLQENSKKTTVKYVGLDVFIGENVDSYFGIIEGENIIVTRASMDGNNNQDFDFIQIRLNDTANFLPFIQGVPYRRIRLDSALGYNDPRITKKISAKDVNLEVDGSVYKKVMKAEKELMRGLDDGTFTYTEYCP